MSFLKYGIFLFLAAPALVTSACNFTTIHSSNSTADNTYKIQVYDGGIQVKQELNKPPNTTELPETMKLNKIIQPSVVYVVNLMYPDGLDYAVNMYTTPDALYVSYSYFQLYNGKINVTKCREDRFPHSRKEAKSLIYIELETPHIKTSKTLRFDITVTQNSKSSAVRQSPVTYLAAFVTSLVLIIFNFKMF